MGLDIQFSVSWDSLTFNRFCYILCWCLLNLFIYFHSQVFNSVFGCIRYELSELSNSSSTLFIQETELEIQSGNALFVYRSNKLQKICDDILEYSKNSFYNVSIFGCCINVLKTRITSYFSVKCRIRAHHICLKGTETAEIIKNDGNIHSH
jgi:hypothetical protein